VGRPRRHDDRTRLSLLAAAEGLVASGGSEALGVRAVAESAGTTTRAVYATFGSKGGLIEALAEHTFELLMQSVAAVSQTDDPGEDMVNGALLGFRGFVRQHPDLYKQFFVSTMRSQLGPSGQAAASKAYQQLIDLVRRAHSAGLLGESTVDQAVVLWDAICSGLAIREVCGQIDPRTAAQTWEVGLRSLLAGLSGAASREGLI
jgi:AcrR family transcriptional regulator